MLKILCLYVPDEQTIQWAAQRNAALFLNSKETEGVRTVPGSIIYGIEFDPDWPISRTINTAMSGLAGDLAIVQTFEQLQQIPLLMTIMSGLPRTAIIGPNPGIPEVEQCLTPNILGGIITEQAIKTIGRLDETTQDLASVSYDYAVRARRRGMICYVAPLGTTLSPPPPGGGRPRVERGWGEPTEKDRQLLAPDVDTTNPRRWEGPCGRRPWQYRCTVTFANLGDNLRLLNAVVASWRSQTVQPFMAIYDTGSPTNSIPDLLRLEAEDLELHLCRWRGHHHPSQFVSLATEHAMADCRTPYLIFTHNDVFPISTTIIEELLDQTSPECPVVGYEMSPRQNPRWKGMVSHTLTCVHVPTMDRLRVTWNLRWLKNVLGVQDEPGWPDTEVPFNECLRLAGITPKLIGHDENGKRQITPHFDHCRSYVSSALYLPDYHEKAKEWIEDAMLRRNPS